MTLNQTNLPPKVRSTLSHVDVCFYLPIESTSQSKPSGDGVYDRLVYFSRIDSVVTMTCSALAHNAICSQTSEGKHGNH